MSKMTWTKGLAISDATLVSNVVETPPAAYNGGSSYDTDDQASLITGTVATVYESLIDANVGNDPASSPDEWREIGTAYEVYDGGPYALDDIVTDTTGHRLYQSLSASNSAALSDDTKWQDIGPSNRFAMFDELVDTVTTRPEEIRVEIPVTGRMDTLALLGVDATSVNVTMLEGETEIFNQDYSMLSYAGINDYWEYYFNPIRRKRVLTVRDLPIGVDPTLIVTVTGTGDVSVGHMVFGYAYAIGHVQFGAQLDHNNFSRFETDGFGRRYIVKRTYRNRGRFNVWVARDDVDLVLELIAEWTGEPVLVIASEIYDASVFFGLLSDGRATIENAVESLLTVKAENY